MSNLVLYRKYRPQAFAGFIGQAQIVQTITNAIANNLVSHAYLFAGPRGTGKTTLARLLAKAINCEQRQGFEPSNRCAACEEINRGRAVDLVEIDAASHRGIEEMRQLTEGIRVVPTRLKNKVFIIDEAQQLTKEASNALLKTLEEPPPHVYFILATTEVHKVIPTIISRCQRFDFSRLRLPEIIKKIEIICASEKKKIEPLAARLIAINSHGSLRDAESLLDQAFTFTGAREIKSQDIQDLLGLVDTQVLGQLVGLIIIRDAAGAIQLLGELAEAGLALEEFAKALVNYWRSGLLLKMGRPGNPEVVGLGEEEVGILRNQVENLEVKQISQLLEIFLQASNRMKYSPLPQLSLELAIIESCEKLG